MQEYELKLKEDEKLNRVKILQDAIEQEQRRKMLEEALRLEEEQKNAEEASKQAQDMVDMMTKELH